MNSEILQNFIQKTDSYLPLIRNNILVCVRDGNLHGELTAAHSYIRTIIEDATITELKDVKRIAGKIEKELALLTNSTDHLSDEKSRKLLDSLAILEAYLTKLTFSEDIFPIDVVDFIEESFENLTLIKTPEEPDEDDEMAGWEEEFEIDDEMLEIFTLEAEELLQNININLERLEDAPSNREALMEIRRSAHTLKGSAGIVGLKQLSSLAHRVEDLLDYLADNEIEADVKIFEILLTSTDCLETLGNNESSEQLEKKLARLYKNFDEILASLRNKPIEEPAPVKPIEIAVPSSPQTAAPAVHENRPTIRVSLDKLDELVKIVGDLLVSRSVFEQRLTEFNHQIEELHNSTNRLQQATGKLEVDFGATQFHVPNSRFPVRSFSYDGGLRQTSDFDSLEFDQYNEFHETTRELIETTADASAISGDLDTLKDNLELLFEGQRRSIEEMQEKLLRLRMVKFGILSARLQRTVRVTCEEEEKSANLTIEGENLEFDTQILDSLVEPLLHLLRNAISHGIEPPETRRLLGKSEMGKISLKIHTDGTHVNLTISDDGRGVSAASLIKKAVEQNLISIEKAEKLTEDEAFELMFLPGLTTAEKLSQISGRGVGMNIVKTNISRAQGTISVKSIPQKGTFFTIRLPMSLAVTRAILVKTDERTFAFPLKIVKQVTEISIEDLQKAKNENILRIGEKEYLPTNLSQILNLDFNAKPDTQIPILLIETDDKQFALAVEEIVKTEEIIIKPLGFPLQLNTEFLGASILGDGSVVPVLDLVFLLKNQVSSSDFQTEKVESKPLESAPRHSELKIMIVDDSPSMRHVTTKLIKNAGWKTLVAKDGIEALEILQDAAELPEVILTDVEMPRMNGYELLFALKQSERLQKIPVVMITSRTGDKHRQKAFELGVSEYLTKPYEDWVLVEMINILTNP